MSKIQFESKSQHVGNNNIQLSVAINMSKIQFEKQITTLQKTLFLLWRLRLICQRYNLKANHN